jgi:hypothetical protein
MRIPRKPIKYEGVQYRSVLESKWAQWLVLNKITFEYEPTKFDLGPVNYIPDFYLPEYDVWIEVKPNKNPSLDQLLKVAGVARICKQKTCLVAGEPSLGVKFWAYSKDGKQSVQGMRSDPKNAFEISSRKLLTFIKGPVEYEE